MARPKPRLKVTQLYAVPCSFDDVFGLVRIDEVATSPFGGRAQALLSAPSGLYMDLPSMDSVIDDWPSDWTTMKRVPANHVPLWWTLLGTVPEHLQETDPSIHAVSGRADNVGTSPRYWTRPTNPPPIYHYTKSALSTDGPAETLDLEGRNSLHWYHHERSHIDLVTLEHRLLHVVLSYGEGLDTVDLPASVGSIALTRSGPGDPPRFNHPNPRIVQLSFGGDAFATIPGLEEARSIRIHSISDDLDLSDLPDYLRLRDLQLEFDGGSCSTFQNLAILPNLKILRIWNLFDFDPHQLPVPDQVPQLGTLTVDGLRKEDAVVLRERFRDLRKLEIRHARGAKWIRENAKNPLRYWQDINPTLGKRAAKAWTTAQRNAGTTSPETAIKDFLEVLNLMAEALPIESVERDDAALAVVMIGAEHNIGADQVLVWFEELRDF